MVNIEGTGNAFGSGSAVPGMIIGGGLNMAGGIAGAIASSHQAKLQRRFQERMYRHRYRYQMQDMRKAGLNPILAFRNSPPGAPSGASAKIPNVAADAVNSALSARMQRQQLNNMRQQEQLDFERVATERMKQMQLGGQRGLLEAQRKGTNLNNAMTERMLPRATAEAAVYEDALGGWLPWINQVSSALQGAAGVGNAGFRLNEQAARAGARRRVGRRK